MNHWLNQFSPQTTRKAGIALFALSCLSWPVALVLPFIPLPVSGTFKAGVVTAVLVVGEVTFATSILLLGKDFWKEIMARITITDFSASTFFLTTGSIIWLVATIFVRFAGQYFLVPGDTWLTLGAFAALAILMPTLMYSLYRAKRVQGPERVMAAVWFALPGMILDAGTVLFFRDVFVNMPPEADSLFAAWLFWGYAVGLLTGFVGKHQTW